MDNTIAHYRILEKVGEGGMGVVYLAEDLRLRRRVALKSLKADLVADSSRRSRLEREAQAAAALVHENVAAVYAFEVDPKGTCFIVMEYVEGVSLRQQLNRVRFDADTVLRLGIQIADGLSSAHDAHIVHRDLKPENVIVNSQGRAKLVDFGVARVLDEPTLITTASRLTEPGAIVGTVAYSAPEQLNGQPVDARTDIFALGLLLYEMATGRPAFHGSTSYATAAAILAADPPPMYTESMPQELERIVRKCLRKPREERYQSACEVAIDLRHLQRDQVADSHVVRLQTLTAKAEKRSDHWRRHTAHPQPGRRAALAALHAIITAPWVAAAFGGAYLTLRDAHVLMLHLSPWATMVTFVLLLASVGCWGLSEAVAMLRGDAVVLRRYVRWFPLYLLLAVGAIVVAVTIGLKLGDLAGAMASLPLAFIPIYERRLARSLLADQSAEE